MPPSIRTLHRRTTTSSRAALLAALAALVGLITVAGATPSQASDAADVPGSLVHVDADPNPSNPLADRTWGVYKGPAELAWTPYVQATGHRKELLAKIALRPKAKWFGDWISTEAIGDKVRDYIDNSTGGDPDVLVQMTVFRMKPWESEACHRLPTARERRSYMAWTDRFAAAIGDTHVALILQPDGPFALCTPHHSKAPSHLIRYSARKFGALPHTSVYIDAGASDWLRSDPRKAARILIPAGVSGVRGFALNSTHYAATEDEVGFGASVVDELARRGMPGKHFVVNTAENGRPFAGYTYSGPEFDNARVCRTTVQLRCVTLGIPPTTDVANPQWGLSAAAQARAARDVDGYLWFGRPWLYMQAQPFVMKRALILARTTPY